MVRHIAIGKDNISAKLLEMVGSDLFVHKSIISISKSRANTSVGFSHTRQIGGAFEPSCDGLDVVYMYEPDAPSFCSYSGLTPAPNCGHQKSDKVSACQDPVCLLLSSSTCPLSLHLTVHLSIHIEHCHAAALLKSPGHPYADRRIGKMHFHYLPAMIHTPRTRTRNDAVIKILPA